MRIFMNLVRFAMLVAVLVVAILTTMIARGVYYWWRVLPSEAAVLKPQGAGDIFAELRQPIGVDGQARLYSDTLAPMLLEGLDLPTPECTQTRRKGIWYRINGSLILYLRSKGQPVAFCNGSEKSCWATESVLSNIAGRMKYSVRVQTELFLMLASFPPVGIACEEIVGHSCRDVSPEEAVFVHRWVAWPSRLLDGSLDLKPIQKMAATVAVACNKPYVPATSMNLVPPDQKRRLPQVSFIYGKGR